MIILKDGKDKTITKIEEGHAIKFHNRVMINPAMFIKEGDSIMLFTNENLEEITKHYNDKLVETLKETLESKNELIKTKEDMMKYIKNVTSRIKELEEDNQNLKLLNNQLTLKLIESKEVKE